MKLPSGMSFGGALIILTQGRYPLQCFRTQENFEPSGRKYSKVIDQVQKYAMAFDNLSDWCLAQAAFRQTLVGMNPFEEDGLVRYENHALDKYNEILTAHQTITNGKNLAFQKFVIFETEVRKRVEDNDDFEWGDKEVWEEVARKKFPNVRDIATSTPFRPSEAWLQDDGSSVAVDSGKGRSIGTVNQFFANGGFGYIFRDNQFDSVDHGRFSANNRGGLMSNRGTRSFPRGSYRGKSVGFNHYQSGTAGNSAGGHAFGNPGTKPPCEYYNKGHCTKTAEQCRFGHYCAQFRTSVGDGCGSRNAHSYSSHTNTNAQESAPTGGAASSKP